MVGKKRVLAGKKRVLAGKKRRRCHVVASALCNFLKKRSRTKILVVGQRKTVSHQKAEISGVSEGLGLGMVGGLAK